MKELVMIMSSYLFSIVRRVEWLNTVNKSNPVRFKHHMSLF